MEIWYDGGICHIGEYCIYGTYEEGYDVYKEYDEDDILYSDKSFENCVVWCLNS